MSYDPTIGRFIQRDPIGYDDGMNEYQFVGSNPVSHVDPSGLASEPRTPPSEAGPVATTKPIGTTHPHTFSDIPEPTWLFHLEDSFLNSPREGEASNSTPARLIMFQRTDKAPTINQDGTSTANMSIAYQFTGTPIDLKIRWTTCVRQRITPGVPQFVPNDFDLQHPYEVEESGVLPLDNDKATANFIMTQGPYLTNAYISFLSCEQGKLKQFIYSLHIDYNNSAPGKNDFKIIHNTGNIMLKKGGSGGLAIPAPAPTPAPDDFPWHQWQ